MEAVDRQEVAYYHEHGAAHPSEMTEEETIAALELAIGAAETVEERERLYRELDRVCGA